MLALLFVLAAQVTPPVLEEFVPAEYPAGIEAVGTATVVLSLELAADGSVAAVEVAEASDPRFVRSATTAAARLRFHPATVDGEPAAVRILFRYTFEAPDPPPVTARFSGLVLDARSEGALPGVLVELEGLSTSTITDRRGSFDFTGIPPGFYVVKYSLAGFVSLAVEHGFIAGEHSTTVARLERAREAAIAIDDEAVVRAPRMRRELAETRISGVESRRVPGTQGDTLKVVETMGGVARAAAGSGSLVVWGASPSDTRAYIDGVVVPRLFHAGGSRSVVASELISSVELHPGGYGAEYGRAVGGLIRVTTTKEDPGLGLHGYASLDLLDASAGARAGLGGRWAIAGAARYSLLEQTFGGFVDESARRLIPLPRYADYQLRLERAGADGGWLRFSSFGADDFVSGADETHLAFHRLAVHYDRLREDGSSVDVVSWAGLDRSRRSSSFGDVPAGLELDTLRLGFRASERYRLFPGVVVRAGLDLEGSHATVDRRGALTLPPREGDITVFGLPPGDRVNADQWAVLSAGAGAHLTAELELFEGALAIEPGLRFELTFIDGDRVLPARGREPRIGYTENYVDLDPRVRVAWRISEALSWFGAFGIYHQPPEVVDLSPVFGSPVLRMIGAVHSVSGVELELFEGTEVELTGFLVTMSDLAVRSRAPSPPIAAGLISAGEGRNYGAQLTIKQRFSEDLLAWTTYSLMRAERRDAPELGWRLFDSDQTHNLTAVVSWTIGQGFELGARLRYASGVPRTPVIGSYYDVRSGAWDPIYGAHNAERLPDFLDLSLRAGYSRELGWGKLELFLDVQNVLNRRNAEERVYNSDFSSSEIVGGLPLLPVLGARISS